MLVLSHLTLLNTLCVAKRETVLIEKEKLSLSKPNRYSYFVLIITIQPSNIPLLVPKTLWPLPQDEPKVVVAVQIQSRHDETQNTIVECIRLNYTL